MLTGKALAFATVVFLGLRGLTDVTVEDEAPEFARSPIMGWSSWNSFGVQISEDIIKASADNFVKSGLYDAGYRYILIDDGWTACTDYNNKGECTKVPPRNSDGTIPIDKKKFPNGFKPLTDYVHNLRPDLKIGIYTSVSAITCGGYIGSLGHEEVDATAFSEWGFDLVKHDTCGTDCGVHNGCIQNATYHMGLGLKKTGRDIIYYLDHGNPTSPQRVYNPHNYHVTFDEAVVKVATSKKEIVWNWLDAIPLSQGPHIFKSWFDIEDDWESTLTNVHNQIRTAENQVCGRFHMPDMLTIGQGAMEMSQYRAQMFMWAALGAPLIAGNDIRNMSGDVLSLLTAPEVIRAAQDKDCTAGSLVKALGSIDTWIRPLSDKSFLVVLINKGLAEENSSIQIDRSVAWGDFYPAFLQHVSIRDIYNRVELGVHSGRWTTTVPPMDGKIFKFTPVASSTVEATYSVL